MYLFIHIWILFHIEYVYTNWYSINGKLFRFLHANIRISITNEPMRKIVFKGPFSYIFEDVEEILYIDFRNEYKRDWISIGLKCYVSIFLGKRG